MSEQTLSPTDFEFTEDGELVVYLRTAASRSTDECQAGAVEQRDIG